MIEKMTETIRKPAKGGMQDFWQRVRVGAFVLVLILFATYCAGA